MTRRHPALQRYLDKSALPQGPDRDDRAVELVLDGTMRVFCRPAAQGCLVFETRLAALPPERGAADALAVRALEFAGVRLGDGSEHPALSQDESLLLLQQHLGADADLERFEQGLEDFTNAIESWRRQLHVL